MAKLVILNQGMTGRVHDLNVERTTIGRVEDNTFQIADPSISSHHCEVHLRGSDILIRDLNSTNGTFIGDARITESILKPGQIMRLGQVEVKLETEGAPSTGASPTPPATSSSPSSPAESSPIAAPLKKVADATMVIPRGVSLDQLEQGGRKGGFDATATSFKKKRNKTAQYFWIGAGIGIALIIVLIFIVLSLTRR